ncbi:CHASE2 domain-containing protein [Desulfonema magnum]|uniref:Nucleotide cyclase, CHASE2 domain-containing n=1 Tax=Desulfonema magnum TaxID=45655 RepID=A0A975BFK6_9BACT|nr:adenylate/guanylate cyclase domain-containing protein [Desulfonema magnum]QTA84456.1 Nucleotide cyclase, CHASE2 domain-containing [Desulfonema magnum]
MANSKLQITNSKSQITNHKSQIAKLIQGVIIGVTGAVLAIALWSPGWLDSWEARTWDWRASLMAKPGIATDDIRLILLDQNSLDWAKEESGLTWPWPREVYAAIINYCQRSGAKSLAFDVLFTEPSAYGVEDDERFGATISEFGRFAAGSVFLGKTAGSEMSWPSEFSRPELKIIGLEEWLTLTNADEILFPRAVMPIPEVANNAAALCNVRMNPDKDGVYRRISPFNVFDGSPLLSTGLGSYLAGNPNAKASILPGRFTLDGKGIPIDDRGHAVLRYRGPSGTHKAYSAAAVLQSEIRLLSNEKPVIREENAFKDKYVFFGFSAPGLFDLRPAPVGGIYTGVEIHATMLDNFLSRDFMRISPTWLILIIVFFLSLSCAISASFFSSIAGGVIVSFIFLTTPVLISLVSYFYGLWLLLVIQETAIAASLIISLAANYATEGRQKRYIKNAFRHYLSPLFIEQLIRHPEQLKLGGERRILSIFFSDIQGFTSISERLEPEELTALLNEYLSEMTDIIHEEGGTVDKYEGDAIIAFWNAPLEVSEHAVRAVRASLQCQKELAKMRPGFRERIGTDMLMRIGINTGPAVVGNLGSHTRFDYTMLGDAVNLAARLEGTNKQFATYTMISQFTLELLGDAFPVRELARVAVVGRKEPVTVYEPMFAEDYESRKAILKTFARGLEMFYKGQFADAREIFSEIRDLDPPASAYEKKCRILMESPPENWQGVWVMTSK